MKQKNALENILHKFKFLRPGLVSKVSNEALPNIEILYPLDVSLEFPKYSKKKFVNFVGSQLWPYEPEV